MSWAWAAGERSSMTSAMVPGALAWRETSVWRIGSISSRVSARTGTTMRVGSTSTSPTSVARGASLRDARLKVVGGPSGERTRPRCLAEQREDALRGLVGLGQHRGAGLLQDVQL